jgi:hypothetical protein
VFARCAGGDEDAATREVVAGGEVLFERGDYVFNGGEAPDAFIAAGERAGFRLDQDDAAFAQAAQVFLCCRVEIHCGVHRGGDEYRALEREKKGRKGVVGDAVCKFGDDVGGCGRDDEAIAPAGVGEMFHLPTVIAREEIAADGVLRHDLEGERSDEARCCLGHGDFDFGAAFAQLATEVERLVDGDAARDAKEDFFAVKRHAWVSFCRSWRFSEAPA